MSNVTPNSPNTIAVIISTTLLAGVAGYMLGVFSSLGFLPIPFLPNNGPNYNPNNFQSDGESESEAEDIDEDILDHAPNWGNGLKEDEKDGLRFRGGGKENLNMKGKGEANGDKEKVKEEARAVKVVPGEECKLVLVVRTDLGMTKGKIAAQASHATLACYKKSLNSKNPQTRSNLTAWETSGQAKIALQTKSEDSLFTLQATARSLGLVAEIIADAGRTQIESGSFTVLGVGPGRKSLVDRVTGGLKLL